jgi:hypothetical protein
MKSILLATTAAVVMTAHCQAADIRFIPPSTSTAPTIVIAGTLVSGDFAKFSTYADIITAGTKVFVTLDSNGGLVAEGLNIGEAIAHRGFATVANHKCLSACALTWLAGARRAVYPNTHIGFHAAYRSYDKQESGVANALVGSYLTKLGFSVDAIVYMTKAAPASMEWLTKEKAQQYGIEFDYLNANGEFAQMVDKKSESKPVPPPSSAKPDPFAVCLAEAGHIYGSVLTIEQFRQYLAEHVCQ